MSAGKVTPIRASADPRNHIDVLNEALSRARATIDLVWIVACDTSGSTLESLDPETLAAAMSSAREQVDAAVQAAEAMQKQLYGLTKAAPA